jgi:aspartate 1-decarboxylase
MLKSKIHRATLTGKALDCEGSIALDRRLMDAADLLAGEQVHVLNVNTGSRLVTYVIEAPAGSGTVMLNGPAARLGEVGDVAVILAYGYYANALARQLEPRVVHVDARNVPELRAGMQRSEGLRRSKRPILRKQPPHRNRRNRNRPRQ